MSFGPLRVFNDDVIRPGGRFPMHSHREMEILTYVIAGQLEHRDSLGNRGVIGPGELQRMSAGTGQFARFSLSISQLPPRLRVRGLLDRGLSVRGGDAEMELAATLITDTRASRGTSRQHLERALAGAQPHSLLARNLLHKADLFGRDTMAELRARVNGARK